MTEEMAPTGAGAILNHANSASQSESAAPILATFAAVREVVGFTEDDHLAICHRHVGDEFHSLVVSPADADAEVFEHVGRGDVYFGINPTRQREGSTARGTAAQVTRLTSMWADLDVKPGGFASYAAADACIDDISGVIGTRPSAVVSSGHGRQPIWPIDPESAARLDNPAAAALARACGRLVAVVGSRHYAGVDKVSDLSRVLRVPCTLNWKDSAHPPLLVSVRGDTGHPLTVEELIERLREVGIDPDDEDRAAVSAQVLSSPAGWHYDQTIHCDYVPAMVAGWATDTPSARNPWMFSQQHRIAAAHRLGCFPDQGAHNRALALLEKRHRWLLANQAPVRPLKKYELNGARSRAIDKVSLMSDDQAQAELGNHHPHWDEVMANSVKSTNGSGGEEPKQAAVEPMSRIQAHAKFKKWFGDDYDTDPLDAELAAIAVDKFDDGSDPIWLLLISGSGNAKTEAVQATAGAGAIITSSISSDAALLSATPKRERTKDATGGLLRRVGSCGVLAIKDVTSILSMNRDLRAKVLAALREVYDGRWCRDVGTDGGRRIEWEGRITVIGAVTTAWDAAHSVIAAMGDRFVLIRIDSTEGRKAAGKQAIGNTGSEPQMRAELAAAIGGVIAGMNTTPITVTSGEVEILLAAADLVTLARTAVEFDYRGDVIDAHAPEMPTRFAKQLAQVVRGGVAVGMDRADALRLAIRCARDSVPPLRLAIIEDLAANPDSTTSDVRRRINKPWSTADRQLQALHMLGIARVVEVSIPGDKRNRWLYALNPKIEAGSIKPSPDLSVHTPKPLKETGEIGRSGDATPRSY